MAENKNNFETGVIDVIKNSIDKKKGSVFFIDGQWGIGKTYFWKNHISKIEGITPLYISLFGLNSIKQIEDRLKNESFLKSIEDNNNNSFWKKIPGVTKIFSNKKLKYIYQSVEIKGINISNLFALDIISHFSEEKYLICIDDIERLSEDVSIKEVFGLCTTLSEICGQTVVCIGNIEKIKEKDTFNEYSEKTITQIFKMQKEDTDLLSILSDDFSDVVFSNWITKHFNKDFFSSSDEDFFDTKNIRILKKSLEKSKYIYDKIKDDSVKDELIESCLNNCFSLSVEKTKYGEIEKDLLNDEKLFYREMEKNDPKKSSFYISINTFFPIFYSSIEIRNYIKNGYLDETALQNEIKEHEKLYIKKMENEEDLAFLDKINNDIILYKDKNEISSIKDELIYKFSNKKNIYDASYVVFCFFKLRKILRDIDVKKDIDFICYIQDKINFHDIDENYYTSFDLFNEDVYFSVFEDFIKKKEIEYKRNKIKEFITPFEENKLNLTWRAWDEFVNCLVEAEHRYSCDLVKLYIDKQLLPFLQENIENEKLYSFFKMIERRPLAPSIKQNLILPLKNFIEEKTNENNKALYSMLLQKVKRSR